MENNPKYQQIIKSAIDLFKRHGIKKVSIEEICKTSNVSKMTFYKYFKNKTELVKQILTNMMDEGFRHANSVMARNIPFREKTKTNIKYKIEIIHEYGDLFFEDMYRIPELIPFLAEMNKNGIEKILDIFNQGKKEGAIRENVRPEFYSYLLEQLNMMVNDEKLKKIFPDMSERVEELINIIFHGIFKERC